MVDAMRTIFSQFRAAGSTARRGNDGRDDQEKKAKQRERKGKSHVKLAGVTGKKACGGALPSGQLCEPFHAVQHSAAGRIRPYGMRRKMCTYIKRSVARDDGVGARRRSQSQARRSLAQHIGNTAIDKTPTPARPS